MTYDPRKGTSTYLGMEVDAGEERREAAAAPSREPRAASRAQQVPRRTAAAREVPPTVRRPSQAPRRAVAPVTPNMSAPQLARKPVHAVPSPQQQPYVAGNPSRHVALGGRRRSLGDLLKAVALSLMALGIRLLAALLALLVVASAFLGGPARARFVGALNLTPLLVPGALLGQFVVQTPFGGVFRGDLACAAIILFCLDWLCVRVAAALRERRGRGL